MIGCIAVVIVAAAVFLLQGRSDNDPSNAAASAPNTSANEAESTQSSQSPAQTPVDTLSLQVTQVDTHEYPEVRLYFQLEDMNGNLVSSASNPVLAITEQDGKTQEVVPQTLQSTQKNICFIMDISGSMSDQDKYIYGRDAILQLLDEMSGQTNYQAALLSFNDTQNTLEDFTSDYTGLRTELQSVSPAGNTAFWDSLEYALLRTNGQDGQKCIVAATDGMDNASQTTRENVISLSQELQIPIYIITFDSSLSADLSGAAEATGGECFTVADLQNLSDIYNTILHQQSSQFMASFTSDGKTTSDERQLALRFTADGYEATASETYHRVEEIYAEQISNAIISDVTASSHLEEYYQSTGALYHVAENTVDGSYRTAWVENTSGDGVGEWIQLSFDRTYTINGLEVSNGYKKSADLYTKNNRPCEVRLHFSDGSYQDYTLDDVFEGAQRLTFPEPVTTNSIRIEIRSVYLGTKYQDTCITELQVF
ncbi:MAG: VWA domain-containing protein [Butyricicoccus sp.]|nr:VWA domain-containing protein [Butyricicoccus sp.]